MYRNYWEENIFYSAGLLAVQFWSCSVCVGRGGGVSGHCLNIPSGMLPPKLRHILGSLAFSEFFLVEKETLPRSNHFLKIQWEIHFWLFEILTAYLRILSLATSQSWKLIPKADLKWECTYFYFNFFKTEFWSIFKKSKMYFPLYFQKVIWKSQTSQKKWLNFSGSMPEA